MSPYWLSVLSIMAVVIQMLAEKWNPPAEVKASLEGQVVLITGANTGLGLEAAKKVAALSPDTLIITTRSQAKGEATKSRIQQWLATTERNLSTKILPLVLDMSSSSGVKAFAEQLNSNTKTLDAAILNAGVNHSRHQTSTEGFEETLQVNTVSTVFLATLLLPLLASTAESRKIPTHLTFISSRTATYDMVFPKSRSLLSSTAPIKTLSQPEQFLPGMMGGQAQYGRSKLMLEYAIRRMVHLPVVGDTHGAPLIIVNSVCPGVTKTDLGRNNDSWLAKILSKILFTFFAKSAEAGANSYLQALTQDANTMGQLLANGKAVEEWDALKTDEGRKFGDNVWRELQVAMRAWDNGVATTLQETI